MASESQINFANAIGYIDKVKERFKNRPQQYRLFLRAFTQQENQGQENQTRPPAQVIQTTRAKMEDIFKDDPDLLREFEQFVPQELRRQQQHRCAEKEEDKLVRSKSSS